ncbi:hypothetical protein, partial [Coleofasciculus sp. E2-BRE-01]|uniref:hypothetical protein n=1 Tax=unclassified Coleofasciculus TaxID=2692782 RepID=UPI0032FA2EAA
KGKSSGSFSQVILGWLVTVVIRYHLPPSVSPILDKDRVRSQDLIHSDHRKKHSELSRRDRLSSVRAYMFRGLRDRYVPSLSARTPISSRFG